MKSMDMALQNLPIHETSRTNWTHLTIFSLLVLLIADLIWSSPIKSDPTFKLFVKVFASKKVIEFLLYYAGMGIYQNLDYDTRMVREIFYD